MEFSEIPQETKWMMKVYADIRMDMWTEITSQSMTLLSRLLRFFLHGHLPFTLLSTWSFTFHVFQMFHQVQSVDLSANLILSGTDG